MARKKNDHLTDVAGACKLAGVGRSTIYAWRKRGLLSPSVALGRLPGRKSLKPGPLYKASDVLKAAEVAGTKMYTMADLKGG